MKNKIFVSLISLAVVGTGIYSIATKPSLKSAYTPRSEAKNQTQGWSGAAKLYEVLRANVNTGKFSIDDVLAAREEVALKSAKGSRAALNLNWTEVGPDNVGGRTRAMLIDKDDNQVLYAGGVTGGLFKSVNGANTWTRLQTFDDSFDNLNFSPAVSTIVQAADGTIYVGTGSSFETTSGSGDSGMIGRGMFKSTDGGVTWVRLDNASPVAGNNSSGVKWVYINRLAVNQNNGHIYSAMNKGLQRSTDGGETWESVVTAIQNDCSIPVEGMGNDVKITSDGVVVAVIGGTIYRSETGEPCSFEKITGVSGDRVSISYSKADENYFYAIAVAGGQLKAIYKSTDKAKSWEVLQAPISEYFGVVSGGGLFGENGQGNYDLAIGANPFNKEDIIIGGVQLWRHNGNLKRIAAEFAGAGMYQFQVHSDKHDVVFDETDPKIVYVLSDGGVTKSIDGGNTWFAVNRGYNVTQFYAVAFDNDQKMMAGAQDNGTQEVTGKKFFPMSADEISGGDGFGCDYSQITDIRFASVYSEEVKRGLDGSGELGPICGTNGPSCGSGSFYTKIRIWETMNDPNSRATVAFENINLPIGLKKGDGTNRKFKGQFVHAKVGGQFVKGGFKVYVGTVGTSSYQEVIDTITNATIGGFKGTGGSYGTVNYSTGEFEVLFGTAPTETQTVWATFESFYPIGTSISLYSNTQTNTVKHSLAYTLPANLNPGETVLVNDPIQSILAVNAGASVAITRDGLNLAKTTPEWWKVPSISGTAFCIEFSKDGDNMFVGTYSGALFRVSNLKEVYSSTDLTTKASVKSLKTFGQVVTGVAVDPNDANNVVVTLGGYGGTNYVYRSNNALATTPTFTNVTGDLPKMPCYSAIIDVYDSAKVVIGTEYGIWATDNIYASSVEWTDESGELGNVPVFEIRQQTHGFEISHNTGELYLGTHSRGMWRSGNLVGTNDFEEIASKNNDFVNSLNVFPNPMKETGFVTFNIDKSAKGKITVFDINGRSVDVITNTNFTLGDNKVQLDVTNYEMGTYFVVLEIEDQRKIAKFIVM